MEPACQLSGPEELQSSDILVIFFCRMAIFFRSVYRRNNRRREERKVYGERDGNGEKIRRKRLLGKYKGSKKEMKVDIQVIETSFSFMYCEECLMKPICRRIPELLT
jgi:hypothetical protein